MISEEDIVILLHERAGVDADQMGTLALRSQIRRALAATESPDAFRDPKSEEWQNLLESVLVPETWFFRNPEAFEALAQWAQSTWLPAHPRETLRILCLPCATGEEAYTIAMTMLDAGMSSSRFLIVAGDISARSLSTARAATYRSNSFRGYSADMDRTRYFIPDDNGRWRVREEIRALVEFRKISLMPPDAPLPNADVIFCRNLLIYFSDANQSAALESLHKALANDGLIFLGPVEPPIALRCGFAIAEFPMAFACRKSTIDNAQVPSADRSKRSLRPLHKPIVQRSISAPPQKAAPPQATFMDAQAFANAGRVAEARVLLDQLSKWEEPSADFYCLRGLLAESQGEKPAAEAAYRKALFLDPEHFESLNHLILILELEGRASAAAPLRRRAQRIMAS